MTHPLSSRLLLLAAAAALAASLVFAMIVAEHRDGDGRVAAGPATVRALKASPAKSLEQPPVERLRSVRVSAR